MVRVVPAVPLRHLDLIGIDVLAVAPCALAGISDALGCTRITLSGYAHVAVPLYSRPRLSNVYYYIRLRPDCVGVATDVSADFS